MIFDKKVYGVGMILMLLACVANSTTNTLNKTKNESIITNQDKKTTNASTANQPIVLSKLYENPDSKYSIKYPSDWIYDDSEKGAVVFSGKKGTPAFYTTVNIQTVLTKKSGGSYASVSDLIADIKSQVLKESPKTNFVNNGPVDISTKDGSKLTGESLSFIYSYQGHIIQQWQIVVPRKDNSVFYTWAYTAPIEQYKDNLPIAKAMLATWTIY